MADETKESLESKEAVVDKKITDADLDSASEEKAEIQEEIKEVKEELKEVEGEELSREEQLERTRLGRRLKRQEERLSNLDEKIDRILDNLERSPREREFIEKEEELPELVTTQDDVRKILRDEKKRETQGKQRYENDYEKSFRRAGGTDAKADINFYNEIANEAYENFNQVFTGNPTVDAELAYNKAKASLLAKKTASTKKEIKANVKGEKSEISTNLSVGSREESKRVASVELDEHAAAFVKSIGKDASWASEALRGDTPLNLVKHK